MSVVESQQIIRQFGDELAGVMTALSETPTVAQPADTAPDGGYRVTIVAPDGGRGALHVCIDPAGAQQLARQALGSAEELSEAEVIETLRETCGQAAASIVESHRLADTRLVVESVEVVATAGDAAESFVVQILQHGAVVAHLSVSGTLELGVPGTRPVAPAAPAPRTTAPTVGAVMSNPQLDLILDMELPLIVRFGITEMPLKALAELAPGAIIDLGRSPDDPVDVLVSNQIVARGEIVVVSGNYGVRITDVISPADRARCLEVNA